MLLEDADFPPGLPETDLPKWQKMTVGQRISAANRIQAFDQWTAGVLNLDEAIESTGLSRSRFYRLAAGWREERCLEALGAVAGSGGGQKSSRLDPEAVNALQAVVASVVQLNQGASVSQLVRLMVQAADVSEKSLPGPIRLRKFVEDEQRRVAATGEAGHAIRLDCTAIDIPREGGRPFIMFACIDPGTRLVFGAAVLEEPKAGKGYAQAAADALRRIVRDLNHLPWSRRLTRMEVTAGTDIDASVALVEILANRTKANVQLARKPKRFGRYLRAAVGGSIGRVIFTPARTESGLATPNNKDMTPWSLSNANGAVQIMVNEYNAKILKELEACDGASPPQDLIIALEAMSGLG